MKKEKIIIKNFNAFYSTFQALNDINFKVYENEVTGIIGPSGCGKSTFLRSINRINDYTLGFKITGSIYVNGNNIYHPNTNVMELRKNIGMVFQKSNPFPKSIFDNIAYGLRIHGEKNKDYIHEKVKESLQLAALWDDVKTRLHTSALKLSGGQQQRLCIARALAVEPDILLMDEPASALDPHATAKIEELIQILKEKYTIIIVTHNMQQAARISDYTAFFMSGKLIEYDVSNKIFQNPTKKVTLDYVSGRFG